MSSCVYLTKVNQSPKHLSYSFSTGKRQIFSQGTILQGSVCGAEHVPVYTVHLPKSEKGHQFRRLHDGPISIDQCNAMCCNIRDCVYVFIVTQRCYGVFCNGKKDCHAKLRKNPKSVEIHIGLVKRNECKQNAEV